jgi:hypothetical protein
MRRLEDGRVGNGDFRRRVRWRLRERVGRREARPLRGDAAGRSAVAALPAAIADATERNKSMSKATVDVTKAKAVLYAYEVIATVGENTTLMEVRKDGKAYGLYAWGIEPDSAKTTWTSVSLTDPTQNVAPASDPEKAAVAACTELAGKLAPGKTADMKMAGYFFVFMGADGIPLKDSIGQDCMILVTPKGMLGQWTF